MPQVSPRTGRPARRAPVPAVFESAIDAHACSAECLHPHTIHPILGRTLGAHGAQAVGELFATLADPSRTRILHLLAISKHELCVHDMALVLGMTVSALSHQLRHLQDRRAVERRKDGRIVFYRLVDEHLRGLVLDAAAHVAETAEGRDE